MRRVRPLRIRASAALGCASPSCTLLRVSCRTLPVRGVERRTRNGRLASYGSAERSAIAPTALAMPYIQLPSSKPGMQQEVADLLALPHPRPLLTAVALCQSHLSGARNRPIPNRRRGRRGRGHGRGGRATATGASNGAASARIAATKPCCGTAGSSTRSHKEV